jgi:F-type H+-transporting ATPase subunit gamma
MSKLTELRERIRAVENIHRITRTLATVSAARLSRTRRRAAGMREYASRFQAVLDRQQEYLARVGEEIARYSDLLQPREPVRSVATIVIAADRGMCGGYNVEVCRLASALWSERQAAGVRVRFFAIGRKALKYLTKRRAEVIYQRGWQRETLTALALEELLSLLLRLYRAGEIDAVDAVYTQFHSALEREPRVRRIIPVQVQAIVGETVREAPPLRWHYEPTFREIIDELVMVHLRVQLFGVLLESHASEQGARMITMEEASERADKALQQYRVQHNRLRRETITTDLLGALYASRAIEESPADAGGGA